MVVEGGLRACAHTVRPGTRPRSPPSTGAARSLPPPHLAAHVCLAPPTGLLPLRPHPLRPAALPPHAPCPCAPHPWRPAVLSPHAPHPPAPRPLPLAPRSAAKSRRPTALWSLRTWPTPRRPASACTAPRSTGARSRVRAARRPRGRSQGRACWLRHAPVPAALLLALPSTTVEARHGMLLVSRARSAGRACRFFFGSKACTRQITRRSFWASTRCSLTVGGRFPRSLALIALLPALLAMQWSTW